MDTSKGNRSAVGPARECRSFNSPKKSIHTTKMKKVRKCSTRSRLFLLVSGCTHSHIHWSEMWKAHFKSFNCYNYRTAMCSGWQRTQQISLGSIYGTKARIDQDYFLVYTIVVVTNEEWLVAYTVWQYKWFLPAIVCFDDPFFHCRYYGDGDSSHIPYSPCDILWMKYRSSRSPHKLLRPQMFILSLPMKRSWIFRGNVYACIERKLPFSWCNSLWCRSDYWSNTSPRPCCMRWL